MSQLGGGPVLADRPVIQPGPAVDDADHPEARRHLAAGRSGEDSVEERAERRLIGRERRAVIADHVPLRQLLPSWPVLYPRLVYPCRPGQQDRIVPGTARLVLPREL